MRLTQSGAGLAGAAQVSAGCVAGAGGAGASQVGNEGEDPVEGRVGPQPTARARCKTGLYPVQK